MMTLGDSFRRLGSIVGIEHTRDEDQVRTSQHGGPISNLRGRQDAFAERIAKMVAKRGSKI
jgi:hypothetical protein